MNQWLIGYYNKSQFGKVNSINTMVIESEEYPTIEQIYDKFEKDAFGYSKQKLLCISRYPKSEGKHLKLNKKQLDYENFQKDFNSLKNKIVDVDGN